MTTRVICIMGPTGSGKSQLALSLARQFPAEIISVDSVAIYRGMDIGTAKPTQKILEEVPHHLINIRDPSESYSAAEFCRDATALIKEIIARQKMPLLVGGTMLYFKALQEGLSHMPSADETIRNTITQEATALGWRALHDRLKLIDEVAASRIHPNDAQRIQRALEVFEITGKPISTLQNGAQSLKEFSYVNLGLGAIDRKILHDRIEKRFDRMLQENFVDEVKLLFERGDLHPDLPAMRAVGYRQVWAYLSGNIDFETMRNQAIAATRQLAKRQMTWLKSWPKALSKNNLYI